MTEPDHRKRLADLETRIAAARGDTSKGRSHGQEHFSAAQVGWRMVTELVAGLMLGFGIGYGLDWLFGTTPVMMVVFTLLGFVAGIRTMLRTAAELQDNPSGASPGDVTRDKDGD